MYYESYQKKPARKRRRRKSFRAWFTGLLLKLIIWVLVLAAVCAGLLYAVPVSFFMIEPRENNLSLAGDLPSDHLNVLLLGVDVLNDSSQRSDTMIVASIGYQDVKLTSFMRDILVNIPGYGTGKLNSAYAHGGPELVMRTLNERFDLNIMHYVTVDFVSLVEIVDAMGGVDISISEAEMEQINKNVYSSRKVFAPLGYTATPLTEYGDDIHLNGLRALGYARIRKIDSDFMRTSRQRTLLKAMIGKVRANLWNPFMLYKLGDAVLNALDTNMSLVQLVSLGEKVLAAGDISQMRLPVEGSYSDNGSSLRITDTKANIEAFRRFAYE